MTHDSHLSPIFRIDVSADPTATDPMIDGDSDRIIIALLRQMAMGQERHNQLLEEMLQQMNLSQKQRANELGQWKEANPDLARRCRRAAEAMSRIQTEFLRMLTEEIVENEEVLTDGEFMLNEFVDRFGPRLAHLNGVIQVLSQLSSLPTPTSNPVQ